jgi:hypothetical protein
MPEQATGLQIIAGAQQPGLFDLLRADSPPDDDLREAAEDFLADPQVQDTDLADLALSSSDDTAGVTFGLGDWWRNILYTFEPLVFTVEDVETKDVPIAAYWVTVPEVAGAKVTLTRTSGTSRERAASLKILGIGGGPTFTGEIALTDSFEADDSQKIELLVPRPLSGFARRSATTYSRGSSGSPRLTGTTPVSPANRSSRPTRPDGVHP